MDESRFLWATLGSLVPWYRQASTPLAPDRAKAGNKEIQSDPGHTRRQTYGIWEEPYRLAASAGPYAASPEYVQGVSSDRSLL